MTTEMDDLDVNEISTKEEKEEFVSKSPSMNVDMFLEANIDDYRQGGGEGMTRGGSYTEIGTSKEKRKTEELADYFYVAPEA